MNKKSILSALSVALYVAVVSYLLQNGQHLFGKMDNFIGGFTMLLLLVISAAIVGYQIFGLPVQLYIDGKKKDAVAMVGQTIGWLTGICVVVLVILSVVK